MRKITKIIAASLLALCLVTPAAACQNKDGGQNSGSSAAASSNSVVGKWNAQIDEAKLDEVYASYPEQAREQGKQIAKSMQITFEFKDDGTVISSGSVNGTAMANVTARYTQNGSTITFEASSDQAGSGSSIGTMELGSDGVLRFVETNDPEMAMMVFVRA